MASGTRHLRFPLHRVRQLLSGSAGTTDSGRLASVVDATGRAAAQFVDWLPSAAVDLTGEPGSLVVLDHDERRVLMTLAHHDGACALLGADERCTVYARDPRAASVSVYAELWATWRAPALAPALGDEL